MTATPSLEKLRERLAQAEADLREFEEWKRTRPPGQWMHRSAGTWARNEIRLLRAAIAQATASLTVR